MTSQHSAQEVERLQQLVEQEQIEVSQFKKEKQGFEEILNAKDTAVTQLQEANKELESVIDVQEQIKEQQVEALKNELEALYAQVDGLGHISGEGQMNSSTPFRQDPVDFDDFTQVFRNMRSSLASQMRDFSKLRAQNGELEEDISQLEARLQHIERLKQELEHVRAAREAQEAKLAKIKHEVQAVGKEIDRITKALEKKFGNSLVVTQHQDRLVLTMLGHVLFESGKAQLTPLGLDIMKQVGEVLATLPNKNIQVEGHTDNNPIYGRLQHQYPTNWELSTARATTVLRYLIEQTGMNPKDFSATGYAETRPAVPNDSNEGRAQNRRVEIVLYPERVTQDNDVVATLTR
jgi:chemotaxis protein MotB